MAPHPFDPSFESLPATLAIFPLPGALLLPGGVLPLNIFEPRYLSMIFDALGDGRLIGMIQPRQSHSAEALYEVGCAGRITAFQETPDGRVLINLSGVCRFGIDEELELHKGYRRVRPLWSPFRADLEATDPTTVDPTSLFETACRYFNTKQIECDLERLEQLDALELTNFLAMHLPFAPADKQAILEANSLEERARSLVAITEMSLIEDQPSTRH